MIINAAITHQILGLGDQPVPRQRILRVAQSIIAGLGKARPVRQIYSHRCAPTHRVGGFICRGVRNRHFSTQRRQTRTRGSIEAAKAHLIIRKRRRDGVLEGELGRIFRAWLRVVTKV